jgi:hypothetical protein
MKTQFQKGHDVSCIKRKPKLEDPFRNLRLKSMGPYFLTQDFTLIHFPSFTNIGRPLCYMFYHQMRGKLAITRLLNGYYLS